MDSVATVLVIDDDADIRRIVRAALERERMVVVESTSGGPGLREVFAHRPDLVVLDLEMPGLDGWQTLQRLRDLSDDVAVLILSGHDHTSDRIRGLRAGADDFLGKPFEPRELVARVQALLRRAQVSPRSGRPRPLDTGWLVVDPGGRRVSCGGTPVELTALEFRFLEALTREPGVARTADELVRAMWGHVEGVDAMGHLNVVVSRLRKKLGPDPRTGASPVETVRGYGYRLADTGLDAPS